MNKTDKSINPKTKHMKNLILKSLLVLALVVSLFSCSTAQSNQVDTDNPALISAYLELKDALVKTDAALANKAAQSLTKAIEADEEGLPAELKEAAEAIASANDVEVQRTHFNTVSQSVYNHVKQSEGEKIGLYKQYCPMAFNNTGAYWLASEKEINNPYFGDRMLRCGTVKEEL